MCCTCSPDLSDFDYEYLYQGAAQLHLFDPYVQAPVLAQEVESVLTDAGELSTVKVVEWTRDSSWIGHDARLVAFLLHKYGRYLGSDEYTDLRIHSFTDISLDRPWTFYELEPLTVKYDGGIALRGLALGQAGEQLSSRQVLDLGRDRPLWMALRWQTAPGLEVDYAISLRLYNDEGERAHQEDFVPRSRLDLPTRSMVGGRSGRLPDRTGSAGRFAGRRLRVAPGRLRLRDPGPDCRDRRVGGGDDAGAPAVGGNPVMVV